MPSLLLREVAHYVAILDSVVVVVSREIIADESAGPLEADIGQINASNAELFQRHGEFRAKVEGVLDLTISVTPATIPGRAVYPSLYSIVADEFDILTRGGSSDATRQIHENMGLHRWPGGKAQHPGMLRVR